MPSYITARGARLAVVALAAVAAPACTTPDEILSVTDPDVVASAEVQSAAGANAVRVGALSRFNASTTGGESLFLLGGLLADEWRSGDTFVQRNETDQRSVGYINANVSDAMRLSQRARVAAQQAIELIAKYAPETPAVQVAEMYFVQAYEENLITEHFCSGVVFSNVVDGVESYGTQQTSTQGWERALAHADSGLALITGTTAADNRVKYALQITRARILANLDRTADAAAAVAGVPTTYSYVTQHSPTTRDNQIWSLNNNARRWTVSAGEGGVGINFATANDPRVPVCRGGDVICRALGSPVTNNRVFDSGSTMPLFAQRLWPVRDSAVIVISGVQARLTEAEAQLRAGNPSGALATLNALRTTPGAMGGLTTPALAPLTLQSTTAGQVDQLFRERAFWQFARGTRLGELRRLIRQYGRTQDQVFPSGVFEKGGNYGTDVNFPVPQAEENNPNVPRNQTCLDRKA